MVAQAVPSAPQPGEEFTSFYARFYPRLMAYVRRRYPAEDAEDVVQETLAKAAVAYPYLDLRKDAWPWLRKVACNHVIDLAHQREQAAIAAMRCERPLETEDHSDPENLAVIREACSILNRALARLSSNDRFVITLHHLDEMSLYEIASLAGCKENAVRQRLFRARARLAKAVTELGGTLGVVPLVSLMRRRAHRLGRPVPFAASGLAVSLAVVGATTGIYFGAQAPNHASDSAGAASTAVLEVVARNSLMSVAAEAPPKPTDLRTRSMKFKPTGPAMQTTSHIQLEISKTPLKPGKTASNDIRIATPAGTVVIHGNAVTTQGRTVTCVIARVDCE
jgi:RNA polymerase sigma-70 factor, ECF subfamily